MIPCWHPSPPFEIDATWHAPSFLNTTHRDGCHRTLDNIFQMRRYLYVYWLKNNAIGMWNVGPLLEFFQCSGVLKNQVNLFWRFSIHYNIKWLTFERKICVVYLKKKSNQMWTHVWKSCIIKRKIKVKTSVDFAVNRLASIEKQPLKKISVPILIYSRTRYFYL